ncbi:MAG: dihydrodipicolinate synthase family protein [Planctomycetes bacterium]|nr:dihydrodipicolinate synthase family protein [Planctomycetota bacterium]
MRGIIPAMVTPLLATDTLDIEGLHRLIDHILSGGVHGLFVLGTTGEGPSLSSRLRRELIDRTCRHVSGRVPVLVGITDTSFIESIGLAEHAADCGAAALVLAPPYYFPAGQPELLEYIRHIAPRLPLPLVLYNIPSHTKTTIEPATVQAASDVPGVVAIKDSSADMIYFHRLAGMLKDKDGFSLLVGPEELLAEAILLGGNGGVCSGANICPQLYVQLYDAAVGRDLRAVAELHERVMAVSNTIYRVGQYESRYLQGIKCALSCMGICSDFLAEPFHQFGQQQRQTILKHLRTLALTGLDN